MVFYRENNNKMVSVASAYIPPEIPDFLSEKYTPALLKLAKLDVTDIGKIKEFTQFLFDKAEGYFPGGIKEKDALGDILFYVAQVLDAELAKITPDIATIEQLIKECGIWKVSYLCDLVGKPSPSQKKELGPMDMLILGSLADSVARAVLVGRNETTMEADDYIEKTLKFYDLCVAEAKEQSKPFYDLCEDNDVEEPDTDEQVYLEEHTEELNGTNESDVRKRKACEDELKALETRLANMYLCKSASSLHKALKDAFDEECKKENPDFSEIHHVAKATEELIKQHFTGGDALRTPQKIKDAQKAIRELQAECVNLRSTNIKTATMVFLAIAFAATAIAAVTVFCPPILVGPLVAGLAIALAKVTVCAALAAIAGGWTGNQIGKRITPHFNSKTYEQARKTLLALSEEIPPATKAGMKAAFEVAKPNTTLVYGK